MRLRSLLLLGWVGVRCLRVCVGIQKNDSSGGGGVAGVILL